MLAGGFINPASVNANFADQGPDDLGSLFTFGFGTLAGGQSKTFSIFYGATTSELAAMSALTSVGAEVFSLAQSNGGQVTGAPGTYILGYKSTTSVPEPASLLLLAMGMVSLIGLASWQSRKQRQCGHKGRRYFSSFKDFTGE